MTARKPAGTADGAARFARRHPRLFHVTDPDALPGIRAHGLLSAAALVALYEVPPDRRPALLESDRGRGHFARLTRDGLPGATLRDQWMPDADLLAVLGGAYAGRPAAWRAVINAHAFFALSLRQAEALRAVNRARAQTILAFDTKGLLDRHAGRAFTTPINTGIARTRFGPAGLRDEHTFQPLADYPRPDGRPPKELAILDGVPDAADHLIEAT